MTSNIKFECAAPDKMSDKQLTEFCQLIVDGGEVTPDGLEGRVRNAKYLITARMDDKLVGTGAVKHPQHSYQKKVFAKSGFDQSPSDENLEIGWVYAAPKSRGNGVGRGLMQQIISKLNHQFCYATTRADNDAMKYLLPKFGFELTGKTYDSIDGKYQLSLYVRGTDTRNPPQKNAE